MNAMRFAFDDAQFAMGKEVCHRERSPVIPSAATVCHPEQPQSVIPSPHV